MSVALPPVVHPAKSAGIGERLLSIRWSDLSALSKPKIGVMVLVAATVGHLLGSEGVWHWDGLFPMWIGLFLAVASSSILNQVLERNSDSLMRRTADRPLPSGRVSLVEASLLGIAAGVAGCGLLWALVNSVTAFLTAISILLYVMVYTPLKSRSSLCTIIGAIPGALPPLLGWTAATGRLELPGVVLFAILFVWQFPHFLAIAWRLKQEYHSAGLKMLPLDGVHSGVVGWLAVGYAVVLIPVSVMPTILGFATTVYSHVAIVLGLLYLVFTIIFAWTMSIPSARRLMWVSLVYLPLLLVTLSLDHQRGLMRGMSQHSTFDTFNPQVTWVTRETTTESTFSPLLNETGTHRP